MINDMKLPDSAKGIFILVSGLVSFFYLACNKNINAGANKAYLSVTNISPDAGPLNIYFEGENLDSAGALPYDQTTGVDGNPYLTAIAGVHNFKLGPTIDSPHVDGSIALQRGYYYSLFAYDSVLGPNSSLKTLILQDVLTPPNDTLSSVRFLNFCDTTLYVVLTNAKDTLAFQTRNVTTSSAPNSFTYVRIKSAAYQFQVVKDSIAYTLDSLNVSGTKIYNVYFKSSTGAADPTLSKRSIRLN